MLVVMSKNHGPIAAGGNAAADRIRRQATAAAAKGGHRVIAAVAVSRNQDDAVGAGSNLGKTPQPRYVVAIAHPRDRHRPIAELVQCPTHSLGCGHRTVVPLAAQPSTTLALVQHHQLGSRLDLAVAHHVHVLGQSQHAMGIVPHQPSFDQVFGYQRRIVRRNADLAQASPCQCIEIFGAQSGH